MGGGNIWGNWWLDNIKHITVRLLGKELLKKIEDQMFAQSCVNGGLQL